MLHSLNLAGTWKVHWADGQRGRAPFAEKDAIDPTRYFDATVPGEIHLDLMKAGVIPDVYRGLGALGARWVEEYVWSYRREFKAPAEALTARAVWWCLRGWRCSRGWCSTASRWGSTPTRFTPAD